MRILVTRPEDEAASFKRALEALGHDVTISPMLEIERLAPPVALDDVQALVATSRNGLKALAAHPEFAAAKRLPLFAVGPATAALARSQGFPRIFEGPSAARDLVPLITANTASPGGPLLHLAGDRLAFDLKASLAAQGLELHQVTLYRSVAASALTSAAQAALRVKHFDAIVLMSPRSAMIFADLAAKAGLWDMACRSVFLCLSASVADKLAPFGPYHVEIAERPNMQEMLALIRRIVQRI